MSYVRTQYRNFYVPRAISKDIFKELIDKLNTFKPGLNTISRILKAKAISPDKVTELTGLELWKVMDEHPLSELQHLQVELLLNSGNNKSCELHFEFRREHIFLSVSDIQTGWGKSVFEESIHILNSLGISSKDRLRKFNAVLDILSNSLMMVASAIFAGWLFTKTIYFLYASILLAASGFIPVAKKIYYFLNPVNKIQIVCESSIKGKKIPWTELSAVLTFIGSIITLIAALIPLFMKNSA
jgi:hypothetical protein